MRVVYQMSFRGKQQSQDLGHLVPDFKALIFIILLYSLSSLAVLQTKIDNDFFCSVMVPLILVMIIERRNSGPAFSMCSLSGYSRPYCGLKLDKIFSSFLSQKGGWYSKLGQPCSYHQAERAGIFVMRPRCPPPYGHLFYLSI